MSAKALSTCARGLIEAGDLTPRRVRATTAAGELSCARQDAINPSELLSLLAISIAFEALGADAKSDRQ